MFISIFPTTNRDEIFKNIAENAQKFKHILAQRTRHQLRKVPNLIFLLCTMSFLSNESFVN